MSSSETNITIPSAIMDSIERPVKVPENAVRAVGSGIIVKRTNQYSSTTSQGGIIVAGSEDGFEKKYQLGEVVAFGPDVKGIKKGDIIVFQKSTAFRLPNGTEPAYMWKIDYTSISVIAVMDNDPSTAKGEGGSAEGLAE